MAEAVIPVDLFNPGQVFACLGFLEAADVLCGDAEGGFDWSDETNAKFVLRAGGERNPVEAVLEFIKTADVQWFAHADGIAERDGGSTTLRFGVSDSVEPKNAYLPARLFGQFAEGEHEILFGYWADGSSRFSTTFKKSTYSASSYKRFSNALSALKKLDYKRSLIDPFEQKAGTESLFRLDPRGSTDPITGGTSLDKLRKGGIRVRAATYPICETLAVIGLQNARPIYRDRGSFKYSVWAERKSDRQKRACLLPLTLARAAISTPLSFLASRRFIVEHEEVKKGGDRKMTRIVEENDL